MPFKHFNQGPRFGRRRYGRESRNRRFKTDSLLRRRGPIQRLRQIMDGFSLANGLGRQPHAERPLNTQDQFGSAKAVDPQIPLDPAGWVNVDESGTLRMQLAGQSRDDRDHVAFARTLGRRGLNPIELLRHRSNNKNSVRRRFGEDQMAGHDLVCVSPGSRPIVAYGGAKRPVTKSLDYPKRPARDPIAQLLGLDASLSPGAGPPVRKRLRIAITSSSSS